MNKFLIGGALLIFSSGGTLTYFGLSKNSSESQRGSFNSESNPAGASDSYEEHYSSGVEGGVSHALSASEDPNTDTK